MVESLLIDVVEPILFQSLLWHPVETGTGGVKCRHGCGPIPLWKQSPLPRLC